MASVSFKCPNCGGPLTFDPDRQKFACDFCRSAFDEETLVKLAAEEEAKHAGKKEPEETSAEDGSAVYSCPSCGAQLVTDSTTAATYCYFCHNPVVLAGRLNKDMRPDSVLPFQIGKEKAADSFMKWVGKKKFVPKGFFSKKSIEAVSGVYYPYWTADYVADARFSGEGQIVTRTETSREIITKTDYYHVEREGKVAFDDVTRCALKKADHKLADGIQPYDFHEAKEFSSAYLSGFMAEKRDVEQEEIRPGVEEELRGYLPTLLTQDAHYTSVSGQTYAQFPESKYSYVLLPTWVVTYKGSDGETYFYAMNGQNGEVCGKLPIAKGKLFGFCAALAVVVGTVVTLIGGFFL